MRLKLDEKGAVVVADGKPVYVRENGAEVPFDAPDAVAKIKTISDERDGYRSQVTQLGEKLKPWEGLDPEKVKADSATVASLSEKKLEDAKAIEARNQEIARGWEQKLSAAEKAHKAELDTRDGRINDLAVGYAFANSKFIEKLTGIPESHRALFGGNFKFEDGKVVGYLEGRKIESVARPGETAAFDEALQVMVDRHARKAELYKSAGKGGSDLPANNGAPVPGSRYSPEQVAAMDMTTYQRERAAGNIQ